MKTKIFYLFSMLLTGVFGSLSAHDEPQGMKESVYGYFYTKGEDVVASGYGIPFKETIISHGIEHEPGTEEFFLKESGVYRVIYSVSSKDCGKTVALALDGHEVKGSDMSIGEKVQLSTLGLLVRVCGKACCDHILRVINDSAPSYGWNSNNLTLGAGNCDGVTAAIEIERIADCDKCCSCQCK